MRIALLIPRFAITGVPLAQVRFARALAKRGHEVTLVVGFVDAAYTLPVVEDIRVVCWRLPKVRSMFWPLVRYLRAEKPDVVFSAEDHLNTLVLIAAVVAGSDARISGSCRVTPFDTYSNKLFSKRWALKQLTRLVMKRADALTCVSKDMVKQYQQVFESPPHVCVYNIVDDAHSRSRMREPVDHPWLLQKHCPVLVAAGRLAPWKGFTDLIEAVPLVAAHRSIRLLILGDGPLRNQLQDLIDARGLGDSVQLMGYVDNALKYFAHADVFVLSSLVEGMPNVLVEAMMCGCTPVSTDCPTGPRELLQDGKYGYLVPTHDPHAMAGSIIKALDNPIAKYLLDEAVVPFEENRVIAHHFELLGL